MQGDGGGPLACQSRDNPSRYLQVGITAWGIGCGGKDIPGVYADVPVHYPWIMEKVNSLFPDDHLEQNGTVIAEAEVIMLFLSMLFDLFIKLARDV